MPTSRKTKTLPRPKRIIEPAAYNEYLRSIELQSLQLCRLSAVLHAQPPAEPPFKIDYRAEGHFEAGEYAPRATFSLRVVDEERTYVEIEAEYCAHFSAPDAPPPGFDDLFFGLNLSRLIYPFFREAVATTLTRMDLPMLLVPLNIFGPQRRASTKQPDR